MEVGESSSAGYSSSDVIWAKLVPSDSRYTDIEIKSNEMLICSAISTSSFAKQDWCKLTRKSDQNFATLRNISSNVISVDEVLVDSEDDAIIHCGSEIVPGPKKEGFLSYRFKLMPSPESSSQKLKVYIDADHAKCSICLNIWHDVVTVAPCLHNFCNGCFSEWLKRSVAKRSTVLCPHCRAAVQYVGRNHFLHSIEEDVLLADPSLKRSDEEIAVLDSCATIRSNLVIQSGKHSNRKRAHSTLGVPTDGGEYPCPQCGAEICGFRCSQNTVHLQCQACGGMMPSRTDINLPQYCMGCDKAFCSAYWRSQGVSRSNSHSVCNQENFKPISQYAITLIPFVAHEKNRHEQDITERCIRQMGRTLQDVISEFIGKFRNREIDRTRLTLNHAETITEETYVCNDCYDKLVSFLLYWFRISTKAFLPPDVLGRQDCWYGYDCRTQHHNEEHARKRNHVCRPTRGGNTQQRY